MKFICYVVPFHLQQKRKENEEALKHLYDRITALDKLEGAEKIKALILGVLSGNIFDWGAKDVAKLLETDDFGFEEAQAKIPGKPSSLNKKLILQYLL